MTDDVWKLLRLVPCTAHPENLPDGIAARFVEEDNLLLVDRRAVRELAPHQQLQLFHHNSGDLKTIDAAKVAEPLPLKKDLKL